MFTLLWLSKMGLLNLAPEANTLEPPTNIFWTKNIALAGKGAPNVPLDSV